MSNDTIFKIFISIAFGAIGLFMAIGSIKEGKESLKKLNEHEDEKKRNKIPPSLRPQQFTIERETSYRVTQKS